MLVVKDIKDLRLLWSCWGGTGPETQEVRDGKLKRKQEDVVV